LQDLPIAPALVQQARLQLLQIFLTKLAQSRIHQHRHPCHNRRDLAIAIHWQAIAQLEQIRQSTRTQAVGHFVAVGLGGLVHDVRVCGRGGHEGVPGHVLVVGVVGGFERVVEGLVRGVVRADEQVLHVFHAGAFEPVEREHMSG
jgi:hypothetical protein